MTLSRALVCGDTYGQQRASGGAAMPVDVVVRQNDSFLSQRGNVGGVRGSRAAKDPSVSIAQVCAGDADGATEQSSASETLLQ